MSEQGSDREQLQAQVLERARQDSEFRQQLLRDPKGTLERTYDVEIPEFIQVEVVEESPSRIYLVLPPPVQEAGQELSDRDLEAVAGGWSQATVCGFVLTCAANATCDGYPTCPGGHATCGYDTCS